MIDPQTAIGEVHLTIPDLDRSLRFYQNQLGFTIRTRTDPAGNAILLTTVA